MKQRLLTPIIMAVIVSSSLFSCAGSNETTSTDTTAMDETTMSETQTMAGDTEMETDVTAETETGMAPEFSMTDEVAYDEMFNDVADTKQYDILALIKTSPNLSTFAKLVETAGIGRALQPGQKYTIFAPSNKAFSTMSREDLDRLVKPENKAELLQMLQLHVLANEVVSTQLSDNQRIQISEDRYINVEQDATTNATTIGGSTIVRPDVEASNGILHVVDGVIQTTPETGISR